MQNQRTHKRVQLAKSKCSDEVKDRAHPDGVKRLLGNGVDAYHVLRQVLHNTAHSHAIMLAHSLLEAARMLLRK